MASDALADEQSLSEQRLTDYLQQLQRRYPKLRFIQKRKDCLSRVIDLLLRVLTLGGQSRYLSDYVTTLGQRIYVPLDWTQRSANRRYLVMRHEAVHLAQFERYGFVMMALLYLLPIFPLGLALYRTRFELAAYEETLRATAEVHGIEAARNPDLIEHIVRQFTGPSYGYMWPFPRAIRRRLNRFVERLDAADNRPPRDVMG